MDLLVTDIAMPGASGLELAGELGELDPDLPVLYISGYTTQRIRDKGLLVSEQSFLGKPFTPGQLATKVDSILRGDGPRLE